MKMCHADVPCQVNLASAHGIDRGTNPQVIYDGKRLTADPLTRLFEDAHSVSEWREKRFFIDTRSPAKAAYIL